MYELEIYKVVMCYDNKEWYKIWKEIYLSVQNCYEEFNKLWPEHSKISTICTLMGCFWPKYIMLELRTKSRSIKSLKEDWLALSKMTWEIWQIFVRALESLKIGTLMGCFYSKQKIHEFKIYRGLMCHDNEEWYKNWRGIDLSF